MFIWSSSSVSSPSPILPCWGGGGGGGGFEVRGIFLDSKTSIKQAVREGQQEWALSKIIIQKKIRKGISLLLSSLCLSVSLALSLCYYDGRCNCTRSVVKRHCGYQVVCSYQVTCRYQVTCCLTVAQMLVLERRVETKHWNQVGNIAILWIFSACVFNPPHPPPPPPASTPSQARKLFLAFPPFSCRFRQKRNMQSHGRGLRYNVGGSGGVHRERGGWGGGGGL